MTPKTQDRRRELFASIQTAVDPDAIYFLLRKALDEELFTEEECLKLLEVMVRCQKCYGTKWYSYDENHSKPCEVCCPHDKGWWLLEEHYGEDNGKLCCTAGCGMTKEPDICRPDGGRDGSGMLM